ncbi:hypothetical protein, conserved [Plasmodium gonderi]|uniref:Uncharacterized protein n=1 Tax=Plasmodium gonderi TaxID=77519 RepID=A0A1Y1JJ06_PLAGO|nr:hypothetical protein, conserved [Plasmodium gonderi]GAW81177.1 hypothetical protein, conserved [Plasmodium gonderi]
MGDYIRKIPIYNDYEKKKDLLKYTFLKDGENEKRDIKEKGMNDDFQFIVKKRENMKDILTHAPDLNKRTQGDVLTERKNKLMEDMSEKYYAHEKKFPFLIDTTVKKMDVTRSMRDVLNNVYGQDDTEKIRISDDIKTKVTLLEKRKKIFLDELSNGELENVHEELFLDPAKNYIDAVKNKNKMLTLKNYGFGQSPSDFIFSYPDIKAKGKGGYATEIMKMNILKNRNDGITKRVRTKQVCKGTHHIFLMKNRLRYINHTKNSYSFDSYLNERPRIILRYKGFQKREYRGEKKDALSSEYS